MEPSVFIIKRQEGFMPLDTNRQAYLRALKDGSLDRYMGLYVAFFNGKFVGYDADMRELINGVRTDYKGPVYMTLCGADRTAEIPSVMETKRARDSLRPEPSLPA